MDLPDTLARRIAGAGPEPRSFPSAEFAEAASAPPGARLRDAWTYRTRDGREAFRVLRFEDFARISDRTIRRSPGGAWSIGPPEGPLPLYRLPEILADPEGVVWVAQGEKSAERLASIGLQATTSALGARAASKSDWSTLAGRRVVIVADRGAGARPFARDVAARLLVRGAEVRVVELPGLAFGEDFEDYRGFLPSGWGPSQVASHLRALAEATRPIGAGEGRPGRAAGCLRDEIRRNGPE